MESPDDVDIEGTLDPKKISNTWLNGPMLVSILQEHLYKLSKGRTPTILSTFETAIAI